MFGHPILHPGSLEAILKRLGMWDDCVLMLDFADHRCLPAGTTQQMVRDLGPMGRIFTRGDNETATTDDPSLAAGSAAQGDFKRAESSTDFTARHLSFDGGDWLFSVSPVAGDLNGAQRYSLWPTQGGKFSLMCVVATPQSGTVRCLFGTGNDTLADGKCDLRFLATNVLQIAGENANTTGSGSQIATAGAVGADQWRLLCGTWNEAGGATASFARVNGTATTGDAGHAATDTLGMIDHWYVGARAGGAGGTSQVNHMGATTRIMMCAAFDRAIDNSWYDELARELRQWRVADIL